MHELIFRYGLPGLPASLVIYTYYTSLLLGKGSDVLDIPVVIALALLLGYHIHQLWYLIFERSSASYSHKDRKVLSEITTIIQSSDKYKMFFFERDLYHIWDTMLYSDVIPEGIRKKDRGMWHSYQANAGNATGLLIAASIIIVTELLKLIAGTFQGLDSILVIYLVAFVITSLILIAKAKVTRRLVDGLEVYWVSIYFETYAQELLGIGLKSSQNQSILEESENG